MDEQDYLYLLYLSPLHGKSFSIPLDLVESQPGFQIWVDYSLPESDPDVLSRWELRITGNNINPSPDSILRQLVSSLEGTNVPSCVWRDVVLATTDVVQRMPPALTRVSIELRIVIDRYLNLEEVEEELEVHEDVIFVWEMIKAVGSKVMSMCRSRRRRSYFGELVKVKIEREERDTDCAVCLEEFIVGLEAVKLPCKHIFHGFCVRRWFKKSDTCPLCRDQLSKPIPLSTTPHETILTQEVLKHYRDFRISILPKWLNITFSAHSEKHVGTSRTLLRQQLNIRRPKNRSN